MPQRLRFIAKDHLPQKKTRDFEIQSMMGHVLGAISFYPQWRRFVFVPLPMTIYDPSCLEEIINKLKELQEEWRQSIAATKDS